MVRSVSVDYSASLSKMALFPIHYAGNIAYYKALMASDTVVFEQHEHFPKQTFRNRMEILGPNGIQKLVIPTVKTGERRTMNNVGISYAEHWQKDHWKSLEAAYRRSPYFEFYEDEFRPFYKEETELLIDFNLKLHETICRLLQIELPHDLSTEYQDTVASDHRSKPFTQLENPATYMQVFEDRHPFTPNLSILDALFNLGPRTVDLIR